MTPTSSSCQHHFDVQQPAKPVCACQNLMKPRRLHALGGLLLGAFLAAHFSIAVTGLRPDAYQAAIDALYRAIAPAGALVPLAIFAALVWQAGSGLFLLRKEGLKYHVKKCNRGGKLRFFLQRATALAVLAFVAVHVGLLHRWGLHWFQPRGAAFASTARGLGASNGPLAAFSLLGIAAAVFHLANGAWSGAVIWKLAGTARAKRIWGAACAAGGMLFFAAGLLAWYAFTR